MADSAKPSVFGETAGPVSAEGDLRPVSSDGPPSCVILVMDQQRILSSEAS